MKANQKVRLSISVVDFIYTLLKDATASRTALVTYLEYSDGTSSDKQELKCSTDCLEGKFSGNIDIANTRKDNCKVIKECHFFLLPFY